MKLKRLSIGTLGLLAVSGFAWSCSSKSEDCNANLNCAPYGGGVGSGGASGAASASGSSGTTGASGGSSGKGGSSSSSGSGNSGDGGADASAGSGGAPPPTCDGSLSPQADSCVISDEFGLFVSPSGIDGTADGTQAKPFATVTAALANISKIKHVYVCAGDYMEPDTLQIPDRVSIYGGFTCDGGTWKYDSPVPSHLISAKPIGGMIINAKVGVLIQDLRLDAANAPEDGTGANSFGLMITGSQNVALKRVEIRAGKGGKGKSGADGVNGVDGVASTDDQNGIAGSCTTPPASRVGAQSVPRICESQGGAGGDAQVALGYTSTQDGRSGYLVTPWNGGKGGDALGNNAEPGKNGANGTRGDIGAIAAPLGTFSDSGYKVASGGNGGVGKPGQGGGGGGASLGATGTTTCIGATGGAGGMGGCGGDPGTGGIGGGASVALLSWQSTVSLDSCKLTANTGGAGGDAGKGHIGGSGKTGGTGGPRDKDANVGEGGGGGKGGNGGNGGNGAGGTGGPSIALVYDGTPVTQVSTVLSFSSVAAAAGKGGTLGLAADYGPDGSKGLAQDIYPKPQ